MNVKTWWKTGVARKIIELGASFVGVIGLCRLCGLSDQPAMFPYNTFWVLPLTLLVYLAYSRRKIPKKGVQVLSGILTVILAVILVIGKQLDVGSRIVWSLGTVFTIFAITGLLYIAVEYVVNFCVQFRFKDNFELTKKQKWIIFAVILACNILIFLATFPGIYSWDASMQSYRFLHNEVNSHYSVLMTGIFGGGLWLGKTIFGNIMAGMVLVILLQVVIMSYIYAQVVYFVAEYSRSKVAVIGAVTFFTLNLIMGVATVYMTQDILFAGMFALIFMELFRLAQNPKHWSNKLNIAKFIIFSFLLCATRNNGTYILCAVFVVMAIMSRQRKRDLPIMAVPIVLGLLYAGPFFKILGIPNVDSVREMMSVPSQQLARVYVFNRGGLSESEKAKIEDYYKMESFVKYEQMMAKADPTKGALNGAKVEGNWLDYIGLWLGVGMKNPKAYVEAFLLNSLGFWYPNKDYNDPRAAIPYIDYLPSRLWMEGDGVQYAEMRIEKHSFLPAYDLLLKRLFDENEWKSVPLLSNIVSMGTYFLLVLLLCGVAIYRKNKEFVLPLSLVLANYLILLLAPVAVFRYCYPIIIVAPILVVMLFKGKSAKTKQGRGIIEKTKEAKIGA